jgi:hypothetical protein
MSIYVPNTAIFRCCDGDVILVSSRKKRGERGGKKRGKGGKEKRKERRRVKEREGERRREIRDFSFCDT